MPENTKYRVRLQMHLEQLDYDASGRLVSSYSNSGTRLEESADIIAVDFLAMCEVLGKFHLLMTELQSQGKVE